MTQYSVVVNFPGTSSRQLLEYALKNRVFSVQNGNLVSLIATSQTKHFRTCALRRFLGEFNCVQTDSSADLCGEVFTMGSNYYQAYVGVGYTSSEEEVKVKEEVEDEESELSMDTCPSLDFSPELTSRLDPSHMETCEDRLVESTIPLDQIKDEPEPPQDRKEIGVFQSPTCQFPCTDEWCGDYNFEFFVDGRTSSKKTWLYSFPLNKIFVDVNQGIPLQFKLDHRVDGENLFVRALAIYNVNQHLHLPVNRCPNHLREDEDRGLNNIHHVLQCRDERANYHYDGTSKRFSVVVPLEHPPAGSDVTTLMYCLTCKGSCAGGMNRRPVTLIFTLERENQQVVGRRTLNIRVCSCPKRDKKKEEAELKEEKAIQMIQADSKKRKMLKPKPPQTPSDDEPSLPKRRKSLLSVSSDSVQDSKVYNIQVTGTQHYIEVLKHLIMLKTYEWVETSSPEAQKSKEEYEKMLEMALK